MTHKTNWWGVFAIAGVAACLLVCAGAGITLRFGPELYSLLQRQSLPRVGTAAPDFTLDKLGGGSILFSHYRGQPVLLTFSASWCPDCRLEAPFQQSLHLQHPDLVMLLVDSQEEDRTVQGFAGQFGMTFPVLLDRSGRVSGQYGIFAIPTSFFIDADGIVQHVLVGGLTADVAAQQLPRIGVKP